MTEKKNPPAQKKSLLGSFMKSTVRQGRRASKAATQRYLPIAEIRSDTVLLKNGGLRAVLLVEPLNFNLKSETEQQGIISGYESFLNTLTFPIQIVIRSTQVNIDPYIEQIHARAKEQKNPLLKDQTQAYAEFIEKIVDVAEIMQKRFYLIIPLDDAPVKQSKFAALTMLLSWMGLDDNSAKAAQRYRYFTERSQRLKDRVQLIQSGLHNVGLPSRRMETKELIELYYQIYNPRVSQEQKLKGEINTAPLVL
jgi:hypothetical protein